MKPNRLGGQTLEGREINSAMASLGADGQIDLADQLAAQVHTADEKREQFKADHPDISLNQFVWVGGNVYQSAWGILRAYEDTLELNPTDTNTTISSVRRAAKGRIEVGRLNTNIARLILEQYDSKTSRIQKILSRLRLKQ